MEFNQTALLHVLLKVLVTLKEERLESLRLSGELAALRNALQELNGGHFLALVESHRKKDPAGEALFADELDELVPLCIEALPEAAPPGSSD